MTQQKSKPDARRGIYIEVTPKDSGRMVLPVLARIYLNEARRCSDCKAHIATVAMCQNTCEELLKSPYRSKTDFKRVRMNFSGIIDESHKDGYITKRLAERLHRLRQARNIFSHSPDFSKMVNGDPLATRFLNKYFVAWPQEKMAKRAMASTSALLARAETWDALKKETNEYFAYGSNMCTSRLAKRVPSARPLGAALLTKHVLEFHKQSKDGSAKADAMYTGRPENCVWGVVFEILKSERAKLDAAEGLRDGYQDKWVTVTMGDRDHEALTYYATNTNSSLKPYSWYLRYVIEGAREHHLPMEYIATIESIDSIEDSNQERDRRERMNQC